MIANLQVMLEGGDRIFLAAQGPSRLVMCTPQKLSTFSRTNLDIHEFLANIGLK